MNLIYVFLLSVIFSVKVNALQTLPVTSNILNHVFLIKVDTLQGTCFLIEHNNQEYLVTVAHIFKKGIPNKSNVSILINSGSNETSYAAQILKHTDATVDVAVLKIPTSLKKMETYPTSGRMMVGQDLYFLGFPSFSGMQFETKDSILKKIPLVKKGILSGLVKVSNSYLLYIDGHNNPGFSGGPVVFYDYEKKTYAICGIISGYYYEVKNTIKVGGISDYYALENSGIISSFHIKFALDIIDGNQ